MTMPRRSTSSAAFKASKPIRIGAQTPFQPEAMAPSHRRFPRPVPVQLPLADELTLEFPLTQQRIDPLGQLPAPDFPLDVPCLLHEELLFDTVDRLLPLLVNLHPALRHSRALTSCGSSLW